MKPKLRKKVATLRYDHVSDEMVREYFTNFANNRK